MTGPREPRWQQPEPADAARDISTDRQHPLTPPRLDPVARTRRRSVSRRTAIVLATLMVVAAAGTFLNSRRGANTVEAPNPNFDQPSIEFDPAPARVGTPHLIVEDGEGGFVGVRSPAFSDPRRATFTTSDDGVIWAFNSAWILDDYDYVDRFERIGGRYFVWIENALAAGTKTPIRIGISDDLRDWRTLDFSAAQDRPDAFVYSTTVSGIASSGPDILVLVQTVIDLDYTRLDVEAADVCAWAWSRNGVFDLCGGAGSLVVLSPAELARIPETTQLFLGQADQPFVPIEGPFDLGHDYALLTIGDRLGAYNLTDSRLVTSRDGQQWDADTTSTAGLSQVWTIAASAEGDIIGVGAGSSGKPIAFRHDAGQVQTRPLVAPAGSPDVEFAVTMGSGPAGWAMHVTAREPRQPGQSSPTRRESWVLHSSDGIEWEIVGPPNLSAREPRVFVGDAELVIHSKTEPTITSIALSDRAE